MTRYKATHSESGATRVIDDDAIAEYALEKSGGGYNAGQVAAAMHLQAQILRTLKIGQFLVLEKIVE